MAYRYTPNVSVYSHIRPNLTSYIYLGLISLYTPYSHIQSFLMGYSHIRSSYIRSYDLSLYSHIRFYSYTHIYSHIQKKDTSLWGILLDSCLWFRFLLLKAVFGGDFQIFEIWILLPDFLALCGIKKVAVLFWGAFGLRIFGNYFLVVLPVLRR